MDDKINRLQNNLSLIRGCAGLTCAALGEKLGVTRQMINNLEAGRNRMTLMQYRAIRDVLAEEIRNAEHEKDTQLLQDVLLVLVDEPEKFSEKERQNVLNDASLLAPAIVSNKSNRRKASMVWEALLAGAAVAATPAVVATPVLATTIKALQAVTVDAKNAEADSRLTQEEKTKLGNELVQ